MALSFQSKIRPVSTTTVPTTAPGNAPALSFASKIRPVTQSAPTPELTATEKFRNAGHNLIGGVFNALTSAEQAVGRDITAGARAGIQTEAENKLIQSQVETEKTLTDLIAKQRAEGRDSSHAEQILANVRKTSVIPKAGEFQAAVPESTKTNLQGLGDVAGVGLDILSAGTYGAPAKGAKSFQLLEKGTQIATPIVEKTIGQTLKTIGKETAIKSAVGAGSGYAYDVARNLQEGKTGTEALTPGMGTYLGGSIPIVGGVFKATSAVTKEYAPRIINSLIKPKTADFSYGKNPGRTIADMGITGNNIQDFGEKVDIHKADIGTRIGEVYANPKNANLVINAGDDISKLDKAIEEAAKGGKNNQNIVTQLQNIKDALLYEHRVNADGVIEKVGTTPADLANLNPMGAFDLKQKVSDLTQFTGRASDDKKVNSILKSIYGSLTEKLNNAVKVNNPDIIELNQKYADLTSASLAIKNRDAILQRSALVGLKPYGAGAVGAVSALIAGTAALPATLIGLSVAGLEKALETTAVKTRIAAWLGSATPGTIRKVLERNPAIADTLYRLYPKLASRL